MDWMELEEQMWCYQCIQSVFTLILNNIFKILNKTKFELQLALHGNFKFLVHKKRQFEMEPLAYIPIHLAKSQDHRPFLGVHREYAGVSGERHDEDAHEDYHHPFVFREIEVFQLIEKIILVHDSIFLKPSHPEKDNVISLRTLGIKTRAGSRRL